jgi:hypothetical protein
MNVAAVIGLLGALVGGHVTGGVTLMRERLLAKREREARERASRDLDRAEVVGVLRRSGRPRPGTDRPARRS